MQPHIRKSRPPLWEAPEDGLLAVVDWEDLLIPIFPDNWYLASQEVREQYLKDLGPGPPKRRRRKKIRIEGEQQSHGEEKQALESTQDT